MPRQVFCLILFVFFSASVGEAQQWARDMFIETSHDFGQVTRGAQPEYRFEFKNKYKEELHVAAVRSSCGCTTPSVVSEKVDSGKSGVIVATFNTTAFSGPKSAVLTVVFDKPFYAETQLTITGDIRTDVVLDPIELDFGRITQGDPKEQIVSVSLVGKPEMTITDVRSPFEHVAVKLGPVQRQVGEVKYTLIVRLKDSVPVGLLQQQLSIVTSREGSDPVSLQMKGEVVSPLVVPSSLSFDTVKPGAESRKFLLIRGPKPFAITKIDVKDSRLTVEIPKNKSVFHKLDIVFKAGEGVGNLQDTMQINTDLDGGRSATCLVIAEVAP